MFEELKAQEAAIERELEDLRVQREFHQRALDVANANRDKAVRVLLNVRSLMAELTEEVEA